VGLELNSGLLLNSGGVIAMLKSSWAALRQG